MCLKSGLVLFFEHLGLVQILAFARIRTFTVQLMSEIDLSDSTVNVRKPNMQNRERAEIETFAGSVFATFLFQTFGP